jgi:hypothetical protein
MTRIPSPSPDVPVNPAGYSFPRSRLLVIPNFQPTPAALERTVPGVQPQATVADVPAEQRAAPTQDNATMAEPGLRLTTPQPALEATPMAEPAEVAVAPAESTDTPSPTPQLARFVNVAVAQERVRRLAKSLPKRSSFGWQRTVLLILGGAILAYGVSGGRRSGSGPSRDTTAGEAMSDVASASGIDRMTRAPLRVERQQKPATVTKAQGDQRQDAAADDVIFHVPTIGAEKSPEVVNEKPVQATPTPAAEEFPVIGAPDGSEVSRKRLRSSADPRQHAATRFQETATTTGPGRPPRDETAPWSPSAADPAPRRETVAERAWTEYGSRREARYDRSGAGAAPVTYPHTDPKSYRDPVYVVPEVANRPSGPPAR